MKVMRCRGDVNNTELQDSSSELLISATSCRQIGETIYGGCGDCRCSSGIILLFVEVEGNPELLHKARWVSERQVGRPIVEATDLCLRLIRHRIVRGRSSDSNRLHTVPQP